MSFELLNARAIEDFDLETELTATIQCDICHETTLEINTDLCPICFSLYGDQRTRCAACLSLHTHLPGEATRAASALMGDA